MSEPLAVADRPAQAMPAPAQQPVDRALLIQWAVFGFTVLLVAAPIVVIAVQSLQSAPLYDANRVWTLDGYVRLFGSEEFRTALGNRWRSRWCPRWSPPG